ncbi:glycosyltransferase, group 2 family protein [Turicibacter sp. HGF1]|uniref:glycosyltransferase family 2 protein n=1 Tax=Turicibacter sp. HGF1 TaxID=910310 RepID=UPI0001FD88E2|nr:glycosyltransferase family 2 protein [Turicibacter sp. HGF1]EGC90834.1 glycosyltransferase, group 2 family protein [Turicibacter sp. HGF1]
MKKNANHLLSVIVPIYNVENYLERCLESIVNQTYKNLEIILVDDGSPDKCPRICDDWAKKDSRIKVIHKRNGGLSDARNQGISHATGEYICFVDSDDFIDTNMYLKMMEEMIKNQADIVVCGRYIYQEDSSIPEFCLTSAKQFGPVEALSELFSGGCIEEATWDKIYNRKLFADITFPVSEINEDIVTIPYLIEKAKLIVHIGTPYYYYRNNCNSISKSLYTDKKSVVINHINQVYNYFSKKYYELSQPLDIFRARYSYRMIQSIISDKNVYLKYIDDYRKYKSNLNKTWIVYLKSNKVKVKDKILVILIMLNIFMPLKAIKNKVVYKK